MLKGQSKEFVSWDEDDEVEEMANLKLPDPDLVDYYQRRNNRTIFWNADIENDFVGFYQDIIRWNKEDIESGKSKEEMKPIKIYINTNGGDLTAVFAIIDLLILSVTPVITIGLGKCYSSGGYLLMAGDRRYLLPNCTVLIHDGDTAVWDDTGKALDQLDFTREVEKRVRDYVLSRTAISGKEYDKNYRSNWWIFADEAVEKYHIADKVVENIEDIV